MNLYKIHFYKDSRTGKVPVIEYIEAQREKEQQKILKYIKVFKERRGYLDEPFSKHITGEIRELRVDFSHNRHRVFYFTFVGKKIILLHAFLKKTKKTPKQEITRALNNLEDCKINKSFVVYEQKK